MLDDSTSHELQLDRRTLLALLGVGASSVTVSSGVSSAGTGSEIARWPLEEESGDRVTEVVSGTESHVPHKGDKPIIEPVWLDGVDSYSLLLDGYSTHTSVEPSELAPALNEPLEALTVDVWVAPRGFISTEGVNTIVEKKDRPVNAGFVLGVNGFGTWSFGVGYGDAWEELRIDQGALLGVYEWAHLVAVFDGTDGQLRLCLNGELVGEKDVPPGTIEPANVKIRIGRNKEQSLTFGWQLNYFNGAVSKVDIHDAALTDQEVADKHDTEASNIPSTGYQELAVNRQQFEGLNHRPQYHAIPPEHWMNEPHAPLYFDGTYHWFYQGNLHGPYWFDIQWGHWVSDDMVYWDNVREAIRPERGLDASGCWTGDATINSNGVPTILYTADPEGAGQAILQATATNPDNPDLIEWEKNGVVQRQPNDDELVEDDFRDPHVWREGGDWYMLVGTGLDDGSGTACLFHSPDFQNWSYEGTLHRLANPAEYNYLGSVWELPVLLPVGRDADGNVKHALLINPAKEGAVSEVYYWTGYWDSANFEFTPDYEQPKLIDYGDQHYNGPSGRVEPHTDWAEHDPESDRTLLYAIAQDYRLPELQYDTGWAHNAALPAEISLRENDDQTLAIEPYEEISGARTGKLLELTNTDPATVNEALAGQRPTTVELVLEIQSNGASQYGFYCRRTPDGEERTLVFYDEESSEIRVDRTETSLDETLMREEMRQSNLQHAGPVNIGDQNLRLHTFIDMSMLEIYVNGLNKVTTRMYPSRDDAQELRIFSDGDITITSIELWEMDDIWQPTN